MNGKALAIIAAAFCAGLFVSVVPSVAPDVAAGPAEDSDLVRPNILTLDKFAAMGAPGQGTVEARLPVDSWSRKIVRVEGWPYCDPACQRGGREADGALAIATDRSLVRNAPSTTVSISRTLKGDRLRLGSFGKPNQIFSPSAEPAPSLPKRVPFGCDPAFSPVAEPAHAHIYKRCLA
jgi:hypothetical protein